MLEYMMSGYNTLIRNKELKFFQPFIAAIRKNLFRKANKEYLKGTTVRSTLYNVYVSFRYNFLQDPKSKLSIFLKRQIKGSITNIQC